MREPCTILKHSCPGLKKLGVNLKMDYDAQHFDITPALEFSNVASTEDFPLVLHLSQSKLKSLSIFPTSINLSRFISYFFYENRELECTIFLELYMKVRYSS